MLFVNVICEYKTDTETFTDTFFQNQRLFYAVRKIKNAQCRITSSICEYSFFRRFGVGLMQQFIFLSCSMLLLRLPLYN